MSDGRKERMVGGKINRKDKDRRKKDDRRKEMVVARRMSDGRKESMVGGKIDQRVKMFAIMMAGICVVGGQGMVQEGKI